MGAGGGRVSATLQINQVSYTVKGLPRPEADEGVARGRPPGAPKRTQEEGGIGADGIRVRRPAGRDEQEHAAVGRGPGGDDGKGKAVVRSPAILLKILPLVPAF